MTDAALTTFPAADADEALESPARRALRRLLKRKGAVVGLIVIVTFILLAVFAALVVPYDPIATSWTLVRKPPSAQHWFGTDDLGRDVLSRVIYGARASLLAGAISVGIALSIGVPFGLLSGYRGGFIDALISRITDAMLACPFLILAIALAAFLGQHAQRRAAFPDQCAMDGDMAGARDFPRSAVAQSGRRRPARRARSKGAMIVLPRPALVRRSPPSGEGGCGERSDCDERCGASSGAIRVRGTLRAFGVRGGSPSPQPSPREGRGEGAH